MSHGIKFFACSPGCLSDHTHWATSLRLNVILLKLLWPRKMFIDQISFGEGFGHIFTRRSYLAPVRSTGIRLRMQLSAYIYIYSIYIYIYTHTYIYISNATTCPLRLRGPSPRLWLKCNRLLRLGRPVGTMRMMVEWKVNLRCQGGP